jgi:hypothetical protein
MSTRGQRPGDWKFVCALSGLTGWASDSVVLARGARVLRRFAGSETQRHPQELPGPSYSGEGRVPWAQPEATATFRSSTAVRPSDL